MTTVLIAVFLGSSGLAEGIKPLSLEEALEIAKNSSPDLRSLNAQILSTEARARQALAPDAPSMMIGWNDTTGFMNFSSRASTLLFFTQPLAFPGKAWLTSDMIYLQAEALRRQYRAQSLDLVTSVRTSYLQLAALQTQLRVNRQNAAWILRAMEMVKKRAKKGTTYELDYASSQVALASNENDFEELLLQEKSLVSQANATLGLPGGYAFKTDPLPRPLRTRLKLTLAEMKQKLLEKNPTIQAARRQVEASSKNQVLAGMSFLPDFQVGIGLNLYHLPDASPNPDISKSFVAMVSMTFPLWGVFNERENIRAASHDAVVSEMGLESAIRQNANDLETQYSILENLILRFRKYPDRFEAAEKTFQLGFSNFKGGNIDFPTLSDAAGARGDLENEFAGNVVRFETALASIERLLDLEESDLLE